MKIINLKKSKKLSKIFIFCFGCPHFRRAQAAADSSAAFGGDRG